ncbi:phosphotransferase family protein [Gordonia sp. zg691]|uniref:phosphotransferase family protein n=1 Tax=Gordonia jinghuaiqii TaxID=2758710 RepID=UPI0016624746|nr:phosphotransferase family protein [Gordonia jinghuaiqii]MBD0859770.1 phosphotransferase family protein [Gordonia jinghuaiqii]
MRADRRVVGRGALRTALEATGIETGASEHDEFGAVSAHAAELVAVRGDSRLRTVLETLVGVDMPELGVNASAELLHREDAAMNSLGEQARSAISDDLLASYLTARFGRRFEVHAVSQLSGGFSKTTTLATVQVDGEDPYEIVLRQITPGRDAHTLVSEYEVVRYVWARGGDVPEPLWLEPEGNALGGPFFASRRALGVNCGDVFGPEPGTTGAAGTELATALGRLHAISADELVVTPVPPMADRAQIVAAIDEQRQLVAGVLKATNPSGLPLVDLLFAWLHAHVPKVTARPVLLHGDPGFHNILIDDGALTAMLDWERARIGDPAQDLAYVRPHVTRVQPWEEFIAAYCAAGGVEPDDETLRFYSVWHDTWRFTGSYRGLGRLRTPRTLLDGVLGLLHAPRFLLSGLETAFEVTL